MKGRWEVSRSQTWQPRGQRQKNRTVSLLSQPTSVFLAFGEGTPRWPPTPLVQKEQRRSSCSSLQSVQSPPGIGYFLPIEKVPTRQVCKYEEGWGSLRPSHETEPLPSAKLLGQQMAARPQGCNDAAALLGVTDGTKAP